MKKNLFSVFLSVFLITATVYSQDHGLGVGLKLGEPTGLDVKYWTGNATAFDFSLGYSLIREDRRLYLSCDYLYHIEDVIKSPERLPVYYGFGARFLSREHENSSFGVRGVAGIAWFSKDFPVDAFFEMVPVFKLYPSTTMDLEAGFGMRYFFDLN